MNYRRINFYGGPGSGKSTCAARTFADLKEYALGGKQFTPELITEYVKKWAWQKQEPKGFDQIYLMAKQIRSEEVPLRTDGTLVISDSPVFLSYAYATWLRMDTDISDAIFNISRVFDRSYPCLNILLKRGGRSYDENGRFQCLEDAQKIDAHIEKCLKIAYRDEDVLAVDFSDRDTVFDLILAKMGV